MQIFLTQLPFTITDLKDRAGYSCGLLIVIKAGAGAGASQSNQTHAANVHSTVVPFKPLLKL